MSIEKIASDLANKSYVSRRLGGVIKAGEYAAWAEEYRGLAQEHYVKLASEKKAAMDPMLSSVLTGGGIGAGAGVLGSLGTEYFSGKKNKNRLRDALTYGLLGGAGGASLGAIKQLIADPEVVDRTSTALKGEAPKQYPSPELEALSKKVKSFSGSESLSGSALKDMAIHGGREALMGGAGGLAVGQGLNSLNNAANPYVNGFRPDNAVSNAADFRRIGAYAPNAGGLTPTMIRRLAKDIGFDPKSPLNPNRVDPKSILHEMTGGDKVRMSAILQEMAKNPKAFADKMTNLTPAHTHWVSKTLGIGQTPKAQKIHIPSSLRPGGLSRSGKWLGGIGALTGLGHGAYKEFTKPRTNADVSKAILEAINTNLANPAVNANPNLSKLMTSLGDEASKGITPDRGLEITNILKSYFGS